MGYFVEFKWTGRKREQIQAGVRYIAHREEHLEGGRTRVIYGLGERYRALRGDERGAVDLLWRDGEGLRSPRYHRAKLTVDDLAARRFARLAPDVQERVLRDAVEATFRGELRRAQGVYVTHAHGGRHRPAGHPHVHVRLSPLLDTGQRMVVTPRRLERFKERWFGEVNRELDRALNREVRSRAETPERTERVARERPAGRDRARSPRGVGRELMASSGRALALLRLGMGRGSLRVLAPGVSDVVRREEGATRAVRDPSRAFARAGFRLVTRALPEPFRLALQGVRVLGRLRQDR